MYAYVINHFGNNPKYLEYEMYFLINLRQHTKYDIIYMYSIVDTPKEFIQNIKKLKLNIKYISYNDDNITINLNNKFISGYSHFNTLRTCNYMFAYLLTNYKKVCLLESDMFILSSIDDIFDLQSPNVYYSMYNNKNLEIKSEKLNYNKKNVLSNCQKGTPINGGVLLIEPSKKLFKLCKSKIIEVIKKNCSFPNETLFLITNGNIYNLPIQFNFLHYSFRDFEKYKNIKLIHYNNTIYKPIDIIKDNYVNKLKDKNNQKIVNLYNQKIYLAYKDRINIII